MTLGHPIDASTVEALTGSAFGYQRMARLPFFDPPGWDPDAGIDQALTIMGVRHERLTFTDEGRALDTLRELTASSPVFVGPLDMGLLRYQPGMDRPTSADHFVAVLDVGDRHIIMHDPQGHPYAALGIADFLLAWGAETIGYSRGRFPLRTGFTAPVGSLDEWAVAALPFALGWATGQHAVPGFPSGNVAGLAELRDEALDGGLPEAASSILANFGVRLGARRRLDTAGLLHRFPELSELLRQQAKVLGGAQIDVIDADWRSLADRLDRIGSLHDAITATLRTML